MHPGDDGINAHIPAYTHWTWVNDVNFFFHCCCCNVWGSQNAHPSTETYISRTLFVLSVIYNKLFCRCVVSFKLNRGPSSCRTVCGEPYGLVFFFSAIRSIRSVETYILIYLSSFKYLSVCILELPLTTIFISINLSSNVLICKSHWIKTSAKCNLSTNLSI